MRPLHGEKGEPCFLSLSINLTACYCAAASLLLHIAVYCIQQNSAHRHTNATWMLLFWHTFHYILARNTPQKERERESQGSQIFHEVYWPHSLRSCCVALLPPLQIARTEAVLRMRMRSRFPLISGSFFISLRAERAGGEDHKSLLSERAASAASAALNYCSHGTPSTYLPSSSTSPYYHFSPLSSTYYGDRTSAPHSARLPTLSFLCGTFGHIKRGNGTRQLSLPFFLFLVWS